MDLNRGLRCVDTVAKLSALVPSDAVVAEHGVNIAHADLSMLLGPVVLLSVCADSAICARALVHVNG